MALKTGTIARHFDRDPKTILKWVSLFSEFFSDSALAKDGKSQRLFSDEDYLVINSISSLLSQGYRDWEDIRQRLASGWRDPNLPATAAMGRNESSLEQVARMLQTTAEKEQALALIEEMKVELAAKDELIEQLRHENAELQTQVARKDAEIEIAKAEIQEKLLRELAAEREQFAQKIGRLEGMIEAMKGRE